MENVLAMLVFFAGLAMLVMLMNVAFGPSKSEKYKSYLANLYTSGRIRQLAEKDKLNLSNEEVEFLKFDRRQQMSEKKLDRMIEEDLMQRVGESYLKEQSQSKK